MPKKLLVIGRETIRSEEHGSGPSWRHHLEALVRDIGSDCNGGSEARAEEGPDHWHIRTADTDVAVLQLLDEGFEPQVILASSAAEKRVIEIVNENLETYCSWVFIESEQGALNDDQLALADEVCQANVSQARLQGILERSARSAIAQRRLESLTSNARNKYPLDAFIGNSEPVVEVKDMVQRLLEVPIRSMLILGETGTGKGLMARIIHHSGIRGGETLVELNCAALPKELLESQLFGHEAGAFTGAKSRFRGLLEQADGGSLFLDEIGDLDLDLQAKILKAIEDKRIRRLGGDREISVDVQIIAATSIDLDKAIANSKFREDLYHRLSVFRITLPPLRERLKDLKELVPRMVAEFNSKANKRVTEIPNAVWQKLSAYSWPGNIRELRNVIERSVLLAKGNQFPEKWLQLEEGPGSTSLTASAIEGEGLGEQDKVTVPLDGSITLDQMEAKIIASALRKLENNITQAADLLGVSRDTLRYRIAKHHLSTES